MAIELAEPEQQGEPTPLSDQEEVEKVEESKPLAELTDLELLAELERRRATKEDVGTEIKKPEGAAPQGFVWVFNRVASEFVWQKDSIAYSIPGYSFGLFPQPIAEHGHRRSILLLDPFLNKAVFALALEGDAMYGKPLKMKRRLELLDRTTESNLANFGAPGPTHAKVFELDDVKAMLSRRLDTFVELE